MPGGLKCQLNIWSICRFLIPNGYHKVHFLKIDVITPTAGLTCDRQMSSLVNKS